MLRYEYSDIEPTESLPNLEPVSDCSAASSDYSGHYPLECGVEVSIPEVIKDVALLHSDDSCIDSEGDRHVTFGDLEIRCYPIILGDHPECAMGPPLTIGWKPFKTSCQSIDTYENARPTRRNRFDLPVPWTERKKLLRRNSSATDEEIRAAMYDVQRTRKLRARTLNMAAFEFIELPFQSLKRKVKRRFSFSS